MSSVHSKLAQALVPLLTVSLLAMGCEDSTAPSSGETAASPPAAQPPAGPAGASAGNGQVPAHPASKAPTVNGGNPGDTATSGLKPAFLSSAGSFDPRWTRAMPVVRVPVGAVACIGNLLGRSGLDVFKTGGNSVAFTQYVVDETWFYRWNGAAWVAKPVIRTDLVLTSVSRLPAASLGLVDPGYYRAVTRLTWYIRLNDGRWAQTATVTYWFDRASDYTVGLGTTAGPGYCKVPG